MPPSMACCATTHCSLEIPMTQTMTQTAHSSDAGSFGDKLWKAGKTAFAESSQSLGGLAGSAVFSAAALSLVAMNSYSGPLAALLSIPTVIATAGLACFAAYKASHGFAMGYSGRTSAISAPKKDSTDQSPSPAIIGTACALGLFGSVAALKALAPAIDSNSMLIALPAIAGGFVAAAGALSCTLAGTLGVAMGSTTPPDASKHSGSPTDAGSLVAKLHERRIGAERASAPSLGSHKPTAV